MKPIMVAISAALATAAIPATALAQQTEAEATIVVSGEYERDWRKGSKLETDGLRDLEKAQSDLAVINSDLSKAQNKRNDAQARAENARSDFYSNALEASKTSDADKARSLGQKTEDAGEAWEKADDVLQSANKDLEKATKRQRKAQKAYDKAQAKVDRGRAMMAEAERLSRDGN